ncbi:MAG: methyltransferase domain-containing protein [Pseudomonadota bacterium]
MTDSKDEIRNMVRESYAGIVKSTGRGCNTGCCGSPARTDVSESARRLGYTDEQIGAGPTEANLGLGCGNPLLAADLKPGETVLDLGSGAGFDAFIAAESVGPDGKVIGIDMTRELVQKASENRGKVDLANCGFVLAHIESLPLADNSVDVVLSNCVVSLSLDKRAVYGEMLRVLRPGGRISISDVLRHKELPEGIKDDPAAYNC